MKYLLVAAALIVPAWSSASAQNSSTIRVRVGAGAQLLPDFVGSKSSDVAPLVHVNFAHGAEPFKFSAPDDSPSITVVSSGGFSIGPAVNLQSRRKESDVGAPVGSVGRTIEAGAFAQYRLFGSFRIRGEVLKGLNGSHGLVGSIGADKIWRDGDRYVFSIGPRILISDARYQRAYFGVAPVASLASGLPVYRPSGGVYALAIASGVNYSLDKSWGVFGYGRYERLVGDAAKSPIIRQLGSRNQWSAGIGLSYTFTVRQ